MDLQHNDVTTTTTTTTSNKPRKTKFEYEDEEQDETIDETVTESSNLDDDALMCDPDEIGGDKTSADYYFDSYSHFGINSIFHCLLSHLLSLLYFHIEFESNFC